MILKSIDVWSCGKLMGTMYALIGVVLGGLFTLFSLVAGMAHQGPPGRIAPVVFGIGAVIVMPILYGIGGFVGGMFVAGVYNFVAALVGGIEMDFQPSQAEMNYEQGWSE